MAIIGLDYDGTFTADPKLWADFAVRAKRRGHLVYIVTMRYESEGGDKLHPFVKAADLGGSIIYCGSSAVGRRLRKEFICELIGIKIDIWIDDNPKAIHLDARDIWGSELPEGSPYDPVNDGPLNPAKAVPYNQEANNA